MWKFPRGGKFCVFRYFAFFAKITPCEKKKPYASMKEIGVVSWKLPPCERSINISIIILLIHVVVCICSAWNALPTFSRNFPPSENYHIYKRCTNLKYNLQWNWFYEQQMLNTPKHCTQSTHTADCLSYADIPPQTTTYLGSDDGGSYVERAGTGFGHPVSVDTDQGLYTLNQLTTVKCLKCKFMWQYLSIWSVD